MSFSSIMNYHVMIMIHELKKYNITDLCHHSLGVWATKHICRKQKKTNKLRRYSPRHIYVRLQLFFAASHMGTAGTEVGGKMVANGDRL